MVLLKFGNTSKTGARHTRHGLRAWTTPRQTALTNTCDGWNKAISGRPKHCQRACLNCGWISGRATARITGVMAGPSSFGSVAEANGGRTPTLPPPWSGGSDTSYRESKMITTRDYRETVMARIKRDREFARLFYAGAVEMLLEGDTAGALSRLRDLVNAEISFKELARQTGLGEKSLHRMLNRNGNPTARNLGLIVKSIAEDLGIKPRVQVAACR